MTTALSLLLAADIAIATPVVCSQGYWDATCNGRVNAGYQTPPTCSTDAGWTTVGAATWQGSHFSSPQCKYEARPQCLTGWEEISAPSWNGSEWVGQVCRMPQQPGPTACEYGFASGPTWTGSAWTWTCNAAPTVTCESQAAKQGYTINRGFGTTGPFTGYYVNFDGSYGHGSYLETQYGATGPTGYDQCGNSFNTYIVYCQTSPTDGHVLGQVSPQASGGTCSNH